LMPLPFESSAEPPVWINVARLVRREDGLASNAALRDVVRYSDCYYSGQFMKHYTSSTSDRSVRLAFRHISLGVANYTQFKKCKDEYAHYRCRYFDKQHRT